MTEQKIIELETKILNCVHYSPHSMSVKPTQALELIAYILSSQAQPTPSQSVDEREGYKLVPIEPTQDILSCFDILFGDKLVMYKDVYQAMIKAAPQLSKPQPTGQGWATTELIKAAEKYAEVYEGDDREMIKTDVINAFYQGWNYAKR